MLPCACLPYNSHLVLLTGHFKFVRTRSLHEPQHLHLASSKLFEFEICCSLNDRGKLGEKELQLVSIGVKPTCATF